MVLAAGIALLASVGEAHAVECPPGDLARDVVVTGRGLRGAPGRIVDGKQAQEAAPWDAPRAVVLDGTSAELIVDLGAQRTLRALTLQADHDDLYLVESSLDGHGWDRLWLVPRAPLTGLRTRAARLVDDTDARYLRIRGNRGDGRFSVAEVRAYCEVPGTWPPREVLLGLPRPSFLTRPRVEAVKLGLALAALALFAWRARVRRTGNGASGRRMRDGLLLGLAFLAALGWWNLGKVHFDAYLHIWEQFHYYIGAKYHAELEHTRLYECTTIADVEAEMGPRVSGRKIRNLETNRLEDVTALLADPGRCKDRFSPERWRDFTRDVEFFRSQTFAFRWEKLFRDHGYNATPLWGTIGSALAHAAPASYGTIVALSLIDPLLLLLMWGVVFATFGPRPAAVAVIWWGTNMLADFSWTGGAFLRQDWFVLAMVGLCLARRGRMAASGFTLTWAMLLRIFPGFIIAGLALKTVLEMWRDRRPLPTRAQLRFVAGCVTALVLLVGGSSIVAPSGLASWGEFFENSRASLRSTGTNTVGLRAALSYEHDNRLQAKLESSGSEGHREWLDDKRDVFERRTPLFWGLAVAFLVLFALTVRGRPDWVALTLGIGLIPILAFPSCYYFSIFAGLGLLYDRYGDGVGASLCALAAFSGIATFVWRAPVQFDVRFAAISACTVLAVLAMTLIVRRADATTAAKPTDGMVNR